MLFPLIFGKKKPTNKPTKAVLASLLFQGKRTRAVSVRQCLIGWNLETECCKLLWNLHWGTVQVLRGKEAMRLHWRNFQVVGPIQPLSSASRNATIHVYPQVICKGATTASLYAALNSLGWGKDAGGSLPRGCPGRSSSARRCYPPAAGINTTPHLDAGEDPPLRFHLPQIIQAF